MDENYHSKLNQRYTVKLRILEGELPYYCTQYFNSKTYTMEKQSAFAYATDFKIFFEFIRQHFDEYNKTPIRAIPATIFNTLTSNDMNAYTAYLGNDRKNGENGIQRKVASIKSLCKYLLREKLIERNPADSIERPKLHKKEIKTLSDRDMSILLSVIENETGMKQYQARHNKKCVLRDYAIMMLFLGTGLRISELVGLDVDDIEFAKDNESTAHVTRKGGNVQYVFFSDQVAEALKRYLGYGRYKGLVGTRETFGADPEERALFLSRKKQRLAVRSVQQLIDKYSTLTFGKKSNKKLHAHLFRKTYGSKLYNDTNDIKLVQDTLGHSSITTTVEHYVISSKEHRKRAAIDVVEPTTIRRIK